MRIVYMGTPAFAVPPLRALLEAGHEIVGVVTATDKWGGRGGKTLLQSAVKQFAEESGLPVLQPEKLRSEAFLSELRALRADLQVVVAFRMLPEVVWAMPPLGTINLHASLLPRYRGAAPINWAVINGETETGLTTFFLRHEIDTGDLLLQEKTAIGPDETAGELHDRLMLLGADLVVRTVAAIAEGGAVGRPQSDEAVSHAPKLNESTGEMSFDRPVSALHNLVRGLSPYPGAWCTFNGLRLRVYRSKPESTHTGMSPGSFDTDYKRYLRVAAADGWLYLEEVQWEGRKRMRIGEFLNGIRL
jgi:methionyl-tRNA formyltransferase